MRYCREIDSECSMADGAYGYSFDPLKTARRAGIHTHELQRQTPHLHTTVALRTHCPIKSRPDVTIAGCVSSSPVLSGFHQAGEVYHRGRAMAVRFSVVT